MSTGEAVVWCVAIVCGTILTGFVILAVMFRGSIDVETNKKEGVPDVPAGGPHRDT